MEMYQSRNKGSLKYTGDMNCLFSSTISSMILFLEDEVSIFISTKVHYKPMFIQKSSLYTKICIHPPMSNIKQVFKTYYFKKYMEI